MRKSDADFFGCPIPFPTTRWRCKIHRAVDGDTLVLKTDEGRFKTITEEIRIQSYNAPERYSGTIEEKAQGRIWWELVQRMCAGKWGLLHTYMDKEKYGRILGDLAVYDDQKNHLIDLKVILMDAGLLDESRLTALGEPNKPIDPNQIELL